MTDVVHVDYSALDVPEVLMFLFHPRQEWSFWPFRSSANDILIPVEGDISVGARFHLAVDEAAPNILFFHGNGEIVADYDDMGRVYTDMGLSFLAVDYRGYGRSSGKPTVSAMMRDCHEIYRFVRQWLDRNGRKGPFLVMGRSLGSASALELAAHYGPAIDGLVVESGFAHATPLLELLGVNARRLGFREEEGFRNTDKMHGFPNPVLIIHAENDHIIPFSDAQELFDAATSPDKTLVRIRGADHNTLLDRGFREYMAAVKAFSNRVQEKTAGAKDEEASR